MTLKSEGVEGDTEDSNSAVTKRSFRQQVQKHRLLRPPPVNLLRSSSRRRRTIGASVGQVVELQLINMAATNSSGSGGLGFTGGYMPSFAAAKKPALHQGSSHPTTPQEQGNVPPITFTSSSSSVAMSNRRGSGINLKNLDDLGPRLPTAIRPPNPEPPRNSLIQIGTAPVPNIPSARGGMNAGTGGGGFPGKKMSLGLSYGPIVSSLDNQAALRKRNLAQQNNSRGSRPTMAIRNENDLLLSGSNSVERSWKRQVDAATARVVARQGSLGTEGSDAKAPSPSVLTEDDVDDVFSHGHPHTPRRQSNPSPRVLPSAASPNSLALDNWFTADSFGHPDDTHDGGQSSNDSSRRNSLAPLPDVDYGISDVGDQFQLRDLDEAEQRAAFRRSVSMEQPMPRPRRLGISGGKPITQELGTSLKTVVFGAANHSFPPGWQGQSFQFNEVPTLRFGLVQEKGGPCGVMAAVQGALLQTLNFGSRLEGGGGCKASARPFNPTNAERVEALATAIVTVLVRCAGRNKVVFALPTARAHYTGLGKYRNDGITETLSLHEQSSVSDAVTFARENAGFFAGAGTNAVVAFLYSAILTRGLANVARDMDSPDLSLIGAHGYCSQELVNLLLTGRAVSNTFDYTVTLEGGPGDPDTVLRGVDERADIGLLSLFEHYQSTTVGEHLKTPAFPVWLVCSESHFSVLWSDRPGREKTSSADRGPVDLYYYDGLARQEHLVRLTINCSEFYERPRDEDLVPPLEHCIRTKWREANVDWNGSEKIL